MPFFLILYGIHTIPVYTCAQDVADNVRTCRPGNILDFVRFRSVGFAEFSEGVMWRDPLLVVSLLRSNRKQMPSQRTRGRLCSRTTRSSPQGPLARSLACSLPQESAEGSLVTRLISSTVLTLLTRLLRRGETCDDLRRR